MSSFTLAAHAERKMLYRTTKQSNCPRARAVLRVLTRYKRYQCSGSEDPSHNAMLGDRGSNLEIETLQEVSQSKPSCSCYLVRCLCNFATEVKSLPYSTLSFYQRLSNEFSWRFVAMVSLVYGINQVCCCVIWYNFVLFCVQGLGEGWFMFAQQYYLSDATPKGLGLQPDQMQSVAAFANIPWQVS